MMNSKFVVYVTGDDSSINVGEAVAKDLIKLNGLCNRMRTDLIYLLDDSYPSQKVRAFADSMKVKYEDLGPCSKSVIEQGVDESDTVLFYGSEESELFDLVMESAADEEQVKTRGRIQKEYEPKPFSGGDPYAQYHEMLSLHTHFKRQPYQGIRIFRQIDLRPPSWIGGIRRPPGVSR